MLLSEERESCLGISSFCVVVVADVFFFFCTLFTVWQDDDGIGMGWIYFDPNGSALDDYECDTCDLQALLAKANACNGVNMVRAGG